MKIASFPLSLLASALFALPAHAGPAITIKQVLALAEEALAPKNADGAVYIESIALTPSAMFSKKATWIVSWSAPLPGSQPKFREYGLEVGMDGSVVHLVKAPAKPRLPQIQPHEIGR